MRKLFVFAMVVILTIVISGVSFAEDHTKSKLYIGFGVGTGDGEWGANGRTESFDDYFEGLDSSPKVTFNFGVGGIITPNLHLGFDASAIRQQGTKERPSYDTDVS
ncbi:MAG: hypothetical protein NTW65_00295, partial [Deltaproteobacteria bacterium]|nr:hypothetical protein [Deltaproteobacteria bacterium]